MSDTTYFDITRPLGPRTPVWPGDPPPRFDQLLRIAAGDMVNLTSLSISAHTGTHADAPYHAADTGERIGRIPLGTFIGPAVVVDASERRSIDADLVRAALSRQPTPRRLLFRTGAGAEMHEFPRRFAAIDPDAAELLAGAGILLIGTDAPSVDPLESPDLPAHRTLAAAGIVNLENLELEGVAAGEYELIALPLRLDEGDGSPVRAVLRKL